MDEQIERSPELAALIGRRLRDVRRARGWSQQALAEGLFSKGYVSSIEHGKIFPSVRAIQSLAARLGVDMSEFFDPSMLGGVVSPAPDAQVAEAQRNRLLLLEVRALAAAGHPSALQRARALAPEALNPEERGVLYYALGQVHLAANRPTEALEALEEALGALAATPETPAQRELNLRIQMLIGEALLARGQADLAAEQLARVRQADLPDPALRLAVLTGLARAYAALGDTGPARTVYGEALSVAQESRSLDKLAGQWIAMSRRAAAGGHPEEAERLANEAVLLSETHHTFQTVLQTYLQYGALLRAGANGAARGLLDSAAQLAGQLGANDALAQATAELALLEIAAGRLDTAQAALDRAMQTAARTQDPAAPGRVEYVAGMLAQAQGNPAARERLQAAVRLLQEARDPALLAEAAFALARLLVAEGQVADATQYYEQAFTARSSA